MYNPVPGVLPHVPASKGYAGGFGVGEFPTASYCQATTELLCPPLLYTLAALMEKDLGLAVDIAQKTKCRVPLGSQAHQIYGMLSDHGYVNNHSFRTHGKMPNLVPVNADFPSCDSYAGRDFAVVYEFLAESAAKK